MNPFMIWSAWVLANCVGWAVLAASASGLAAVRAQPLSSITEIVGAVAALCFGLVAPQALVFQRLLGGGCRWAINTCIAMIAMLVAMQAGVYVIFTVGLSSSYWPIWLNTIFWPALFCAAPLAAGGCVQSRLLESLGVKAIDWPVLCALAGVVAGAFLGVASFGPDSLSPTWKVVMLAAIAGMLYGAVSGVKLRQIAMSR
jgi:hypothetical protein